MMPTGPKTKTSFTEGFFDVAAQKAEADDGRNALADAEFSQNACEGARENTKKPGLKIVYDKSYPPATTDFTPIVQALKATNPDLVLICSYPVDSVGMVVAANEPSSTRN